MIVQNLPPRFVRIVEFLFTLLIVGDKTMTILILSFVTTVGIFAFGGAIAYKLGLCDEE